MQMLSDVQPEQYLRVGDTDYWFSGIIDNPAIGNPSTLLSLPHGLCRHVKEKAAKKLEVEIVELVSKRQTTRKSETNQLRLFSRD